MADSSDSTNVSHEKDRRPSVESLKRASAVISKKPNVPSQVEAREGQNDELEKNGEPPDSYIKSKLNRQGSRQYRNEGWRSSQKRLVKTDSTSSIKSNVSDKSVGETSKPLAQIVLPQISSAENQAYVHQKFADITNILKDTGVDDSLLEDIKN